MYEFAVTPAVTQLRRPGVIITEVTPDSLAEELELQPNDRIVRVNGRPVRDYLDFRFQTAGETELTFQVKKTNGETLLVVQVAGSTSAVGKTSNAEHVYPTGQTRLGKGALDSPSEFTPMYCH